MHHAIAFAHQKGNAAGKVITALLMLGLIALGATLINRDIGKRDDAPPAAAAAISPS